MTNEIDKLKAELAQVTAERDKLAQQMWGIATKEITVHDGAVTEAIRRMTGIHDELMHAAAGAVHYVAEMLNRKARERFLGGDADRPKGSATRADAEFTLEVHQDAAANNTCTLRLDVRNLWASTTLDHRAAHIMREIAPNPKDVRRAKSTRSTAGHAGDAVQYAADLRAFQAFKAGKAGAEIPADIQSLKDALGVKGKGL